MRKFERNLVLGATCCLVLQAMLACSSEDTGSEALDSNETSATAGSPTAGTTTSGPSTTMTSGVTSTSGGVGVATTSGTPTTSGTTGAPVTTGTTGFGTTGATGTGGASSVTTSTTSVTDSGVTGSTTGGEDEVFCDATLTGEDFYMRPQSCVHCHAEDALGTEDGPEVRHPNADYVRWLIREGRMDHPDFPDGMPAVPPECLTDQMIEEIITFLNSFPQPTTGAELYADYCASCHGADGQGGITGIGLDGELHHNADISVSGNDTMNYTSRETYMPGQGDKLSAAEIQLITDYLQNELGFAF